MTHLELNRRPGAGWPGPPVTLELGRVLVVNDLVRIALIALGAVILAKLLASKIPALRPLTPYL